MKKFNINEYMYIQITKEGWEHLRKTVSEDYIKHCIKGNGYEVVINGVTWHRLQAHDVFSLLPITLAKELLYETNVMFDDKALKQCDC